MRESSRACVDARRRCLHLSPAARGVAGMWAANVALCVALGLLTARTLGQSESLRLSESGWLQALSQWRRPLEADLSLGFGLADSSRAQGWLESAVLED